MDSSEKKELSEIDICDLFITPAIKDSGWDQLTQIRREVTLTPGPVIVRGNISSRNKKKKKFADYVLLKESGVPIAVVEAKDNNHNHNHNHNHTVSHGTQQALGYADILNVPSTSSSNGDAFASHNQLPQPGEDAECELGLDAISNWVIPLPPLNEQHGIVAKFNGLMARCESMKQQIRTAKSTQLKLADAVAEKAVG